MYSHVHNLILFHVFANEYTWHEPSKSIMTVYLVCIRYSSSCLSAIWTLKGFHLVSLGHITPIYYSVQCYGHKQSRNHDHLPPYVVTDCIFSYHVQGEKYQLATTLDQSQDAVIQMFCSINWTLLQHVTTKDASLPLLNAADRTPGCIYWHMWLEMCCLWPKLLRDYISISRKYRRRKRLIQTRPQWSDHEWLGYASLTQYFLNELCCTGFK